MLLPKKKEGTSRPKAGLCSVMGLTLIKYAQEYITQWSQLRSLQEKFKTPNEETIQLFSEISGIGLKVKIMHVLQQEFCGWIRKPNLHSGRR